MFKIFHLIKKCGLACALKKIKRRIFIRDEVVISQIAMLGAYDYIQKYKYVLNQPVEIPASDVENPYPNKIWTIWLQGMENAPEIVQHCIASIQKRYEDDLMILTQNNFSHYVDIPDFVIEKNKKGIITNTHYSDIIRFSLITKYGGMWLDSTIFLLDNIPDYMRFADIFFYNVCDKKIMASINVMAAKPYHPIICKTTDLLMAYWKKENRTVSYSITMLLLAMAIHSSQETKSWWNSMPYIDCINKDLLSQKLFDQYNATDIEIMKQLSVIQKLSYKFSKEKYEIKGTFYDRLVKGT